MTPEVTVLMSVYNGEKYLKESIESILSQTFENFEFIIIDDGSLDDSNNLIKRYKDPRIRLIENRKNIGLTKSLNIGIKEAKGKYIARQDADDQSLPRRLEIQLTFMKNNPEIGISGTWVKYLINGKHLIRKTDLNHNKIKSWLLFEPIINHPTFIIRRLYINNNHDFYDENFIFSQDYELLCKRSQDFKLANIGKVLVYCNIHDKQISKANKKEQDKLADKIRLNQLIKLGINPSSREIDIHKSISLRRYSTKWEFILLTKTWLIKLIEKNRSYQSYPEPEFSNIIAQKWYEIHFSKTY